MTPARRPLNPSRGPDELTDRCTSLVALRGVIDAGHSRDLGVRRAAGVGGGLRPAGAGAAARRAAVPCAPPASVRGRARRAGGRAGRGRGGDLAAKAVDDELTLRLPSVADGPLASPELVRPSAEDPAGTPAAGRIALAALAGPGAGLRAVRRDDAAARAGRPGICGWRRRAGSVGLSADEQACAAAVGGRRPAAAGDLAVGGSIGYLAAVARFADDLVSRGRVLPALTSEDDGYAARWRPVLSAADAQRARELAAAIPPACRAAADTAPGPLLAGMLDALADATARTRLPGALLPARRGRRPAQIPFIERTVASLTASDPLVEVEGAADEREARELTPAFAEWLAAAARPAGPVRTCFRLVEPPDPGPARSDADGAATSAEVAWRRRRDWLVELSLQSAEDPSLMLPALDVWDGAGFGWLAGDADPGGGTAGRAGRGRAAVPGARRGAARGRADPAHARHRGRARLPARDRAAAVGRGVRRAAAGLGAQGAARAEADRQVVDRLVPVGRAGPVRTAGPASTSGTSWRSGDEVLSPEELAELARLKVPLVRIRGQWVELDDRHLKAALKFFEGGRSGTMTAAEVLTAAIGAGGERG